MQCSAVQIAVSAAAGCCAFLAWPSSAATVAWKSNVQGYMNVASNWAGDALPQEGDTLDMSVLTSPSSMYVGDFGDERRFETMTLWRTSKQLVLREGTLRLRHLDYSSNVFGLSTEVVLDVSGAIRSSGTQFFAGCGPATVVAGEINHAGGHAYMCSSSAFDGHLAVKAGKFTISNSGYLSLSTSTKNSAYGVRYVVGAGGLSFGDGATESAFYQNALQNKVRIDPAADYALGVNPAREVYGDNLAFMCHESTTYFGTTDYYDSSLPRTVTFEGGIGADYVSGRNVVVDGIGTLVFKACGGSHRFNGALTVNDSATLVLRDTAEAGRGTMTFGGGTTLRVEQSGAGGTVQLWNTLACAAGVTLEICLADGATAPPLRLYGFVPPDAGRINVRVRGYRPGRPRALVGSLPPGMTARRFALAEKPGPRTRLFIDGNRLVIGEDGLVIKIGGAAAETPAPPATFLLAGDSTLDDYHIDKPYNPPFASWGTTLECFMRAGCKVANYAKSGATMASFVSSGRWSSLLAAVKPGDFVGIQFGHNDQKASGTPEQLIGAFKANVRNFVAQIRERGAEPVLLSPIVRGTFAGGVLVDNPVNGTTLGDYAGAMRELGEELGAEFVDMNALTRGLLERVGREEAAKFFTASSGFGATDFTHPVPAGADAFARLFVDEVKARKLKVSGLFR